MKEMSTDEFTHHIKEAFEAEYFGKEDNFLMSKSALLDGLQFISVHCMMLEDEANTTSDKAEGITFLQEFLSHFVFELRQMQAVANLLSIGLDGICFKSS